MRRLFGARHDDADRLDLIDRRIGAVAPAREAIEQHFAVDLPAQLRLEREAAEEVEARG